MEHTPSPLSTSLDLFKIRSIRFRHFSPLLFHCCITVLYCTPDFFNIRLQSSRFCANDCRLAAPNKSLASFLMSHLRDRGFPLFLFSRQCPLIFYLLPFFQYFLPIWLSGTKFTKLSSLCKIWSKSSLYKPRSGWIIWKRRGERSKDITIGTCSHYLTSSNSKVNAIMQKYFFRYKINVNYYLNCYHLEVTWLFIENWISKRHSIAIKTVT